VETRLLLSGTGGSRFSSPVIVRPEFERIALNGIGATPMAAGWGTPVSPDGGTATPQGLSPNQIGMAYGISSVVFGSVIGDGTGQTIAIVDAYDNPSFVNSAATSFATSDLARFDAQFGLPSPPSFTKLNQRGGATGLPATDPSGGWEIEEALDVEWAHALAPGASIVLVECDTANTSDMFTGVQTAAALPGVSAISMSWGAGEFPGETSFDSTFTTPHGHAGVTFLGATGDAGAPGSYPAYSPNVVAVGGTTLTLQSSGAYSSESGWSGSGGGTSTQEPEPSFQHAVQSSGWRETPDVSFDASPASGVSVYDSFTNGSSHPWEQVGGTSLATPCFSALVAIANQGRVLKGGSPLDGPTQTLADLYALPGSDFHDITSGNNGYAAGPGYDEVTGRGTPVANLVVPALAGAGLSDTLAVTTQPASPVTAGAPFGLTISVESSGGSVDTSATGSISLSVNTGPGGAVLGGTTTATIANGVATFSNLVLTEAASNYTLAAASTGFTPVITSLFTVSPSVPYQLAISSAPARATAGSPFTITVSVEDQYGNLEAGNGPSVSVGLAAGPAGAVLGGMTTAPASAGIASFSSLFLTKAAGGYQIAATSSGLVPAATTPFSVKPAAASLLAFTSSPPSLTAGSPFGLSVMVEDSYGNQVSSSGAAVTLSLASGPASERSTFGVTSLTSAGLATFSGLVLTVAATDYLAEATASGLTPASTSTFSVTPAPASQLSFSAPPASVTAGSSFGLFVLIEDPYGNQVATSGTTVSIGLASGPASESAALSAATSSTSGLASVTGLALTTAASYQIAASASNLTPATTSLIVTPAAPAQLALGTSPSSVTAGSPFGLAVLVEDSYGNPVTTSGTSITLGLASGPPSESAAVSAIASTTLGTASFSGLILTTAGSNYVIAATASGLTSASTPLAVTPAAASQLAITAAPSSVAAGSPFGITAWIEDRFQNVVTSTSDQVSLSLAAAPSGSGLGGLSLRAAARGVAVFTGLTLTAAATDYKIAASASGLTSALSPEFTVTAGSASHLALEAPPPTVLTAGQTFGLAVTARDAYGNLVATFGAPVEAALEGAPAAGSLSGPSAVTAASGSASFSNLVLTNAASGIVLSVTSPGLPALAVGPFTVTPASPAQILVAAEPPAFVTAGAPFGFSIMVEDRYGNRETSLGGSVSAQLAGNLTGTTLSGDLSAALNGGAASFSNLELDRAGAGYTLVATAGSLTSAPSTTVAVTPGAAVAAVIAVEPAAQVQAGRPFGLTVVIEDQFGNIATSFGGRVLAALPRNKANARLRGSAAVAASAGVATFSNLIISKPGKSFTLRVTPAGLPGLTTTAFQVAKAATRRPAIRVHNRPR
jgi:hypothetical protein